MADMFRSETCVSGNDDLIVREHLSIEEWRSWINRTYPGMIRLWHGWDDDGAWEQYGTDYYWSRIEKI